MIKVAQMFEDQLCRHGVPYDLQCPDCMQWAMDEIERSKSSENEEEELPEIPTRDEA